MAEGPDASPALPGPSPDSEPAAEGVEVRPATPDAKEDGREDEALVADELAAGIASVFASIRSLEEVGEDGASDEADDADADSDDEDDGHDPDQVTLQLLGELDRLWQSPHH